MVDENLPILPAGDRRLRYLFLDLNSYFASVEQQEHPEFRSKPLAVVPVMADTSFVIAASYEAKRCGIRTGTQIGEAKNLCPDLILTKGNHPMYGAYHDRVIEAVEEVLPIEQVCSIDEMRFKLLGEEREPERARELAMEIKAIIRERVGQCMTCSVGVAPNPFLSKIGTELQKPDGLVIIQAHELPEKLHSLKLTDFTGINKRMQVRLNSAGIFTSGQLCAASKQELHHAFGGIIGDRWWYLLRGYDLPGEATKQRTLGHSHVLAPNLRTDQGPREVMLRLLQKASARLRQEELFAGGMVIAVKGFEKSWKAVIPLSGTQDTVRLNAEFLKAWETRDYKKPRMAAITFYDLRKPEAVTPSLFDEENDRSELNHAVDDLNQKFGKNTIYLAGMKSAKDAAEERIAFNKTWLFKEGKDDNVWVDTFRGNKPKRDKSQ